MDSKELNDDAINKARQEMLFYTYVLLLLGIIFGILSYVGLGEIIQKASGRPLASNVSSFIDFINFGLHIISSFLIAGAVTIYISYKLYNFAFLGLFSIITDASFL